MLQQQIVNRTDNKKSIQQEKPLNLKKTKQKKKKLNALYVRAA